MRTNYPPDGAPEFELKVCEKVNFPARTLLHILLIMLIGFLAYSNTFKDPFQWDDNYYIKENPTVKDFSYFFDPSRAKGLDFYGALKSRYVGYLSFAVNYSLNGLDVTGYHVFNFIVHILNALLVYFFVVLIFRSPFLSGYPLKEQSGYIAFFTGLLFAIHPVQTEAVTYIFQRLASLSAFFYLSSIVFYLLWRNGPREEKQSYRSAYFFAFWRENVFYFLSLIAAITAMKTKENAFTLPIVIAVLEFLFFTGALRQRVIRLVPFALTMLIVPLTLIGIDRPIGEIVGALESSTKGYGGLPREDYLFTELRVITTYIRLLFLPINQNLDYDYPVFHSIMEPEVFLSFLLFISVLSLALYIYFRSRFVNPVSRLVALGILWFFITISIESSMIPLPTLIDEYRLYLPSVGFFLSTMTGAFLFLGKVKSRVFQKALIWAVMLVPLAFSAATYSRNNIWKSRVSLWEDVVKKSPNKPGPHNNLGNAYLSMGMTDKAIEQYKAVLRLKPDFAEAHLNLGVALESKGQMDEASAHYVTALSYEPDYEKALFNLGLISLDRGETGEARRYFEAVLMKNPRHPEARLFIDYIDKDGQAPIKAKPAR